MKLRVLLISWLIPVAAYSQKDKVAISFCPPALFDTYSFPTIQGGVLVRLSEKLSWYNELGIQYRTPSYKTADTAFLDNYGYKLKTEIRYYSPVQANRKKNIPPERSYVAFNSFLIREAYNSGADYTPHWDSTHEHLDDFGVKKTVLGFNVILGCEEPIGKRFMIDLYVGVGARMRFIHTVHQEADFYKDWLNTLPFYIVDEARTRMEVKGGYSGALNLSAGIRLCFRL